MAKGVETGQCPGQHPGRTAPRTWPITLADHLAIFLRQAKRRSAQDDDDKAAN